MRCLPDTLMREVCILSFILSLPSARQGVDINARGEWKVLPAPLEHINLHVRGGYILPLQEPALNTNLR